MLYEVITHDVVDLVAVDGFVFHQRIGHHVQLVDVVLENLLRTRIGAVDDGADLAVDIVRGLVGDRLVLGNRVASYNFV